MRAIDAISHIELYGNALGVLSDCLRGFLVAPPGYDLIAGDWSAIEARKLAWLAGEDRVLDAFRTHGKIYEQEAAGIYHVRMEDVTPTQRQIGKVAILALGYQGGTRAFQSMARNYNVKVTDKEAKVIKDAWRAANPNIVKFWWDLETAAIAAVLTPGETYHAGHPARPIKFKMKGSFLWCRLPSGRCLCYPYPRIEQIQTPWGDIKDALTYMSQNSLTRKWERSTAYGGLLCENVTQASSRDLLADGMLRVEKAGYPVVMHVHDEVVSEIRSGIGSVSEFESLLATVPTWAKDLPIEVKGWRGKRYQK